jgi:hypothetical protein
LWNAKGPPCPLPYFVSRNSYIGLANIWEVYKLQVRVSDQTSVTASEINKPHCYMNNSRGGIRPNTGVLDSKNIVKAAYM